MRLPWGLRWWELLPEAVVAIGLGIFFITEADAATSAFKSTRAIVLMVVVGAAWLAARFVLVQYTRLPLLRLAVFAAAGFVVLNVVVLPAYDDTTVVEALPTVDAQPTSTTSTTAATSPTTGTPPSTTTTTTAPAGPVALRSGAFRGIDHRASGAVVIYQQPDGSLVVGLEEIDIQPGPDYDVYVVPGAEREDPDGGTRLDDLRGNKGTQYYPVPAGADVANGDWTVLVWCQTFDVPVAAATPS